MRRFLACVAVVALVGACGEKPAPPTSKPQPKEPERAAPVLTAASYSYEILSHDTPLSMMADSSIVVTVGVKNTSDRPWPSKGTIKLGCYWMDAEGQRLKSPEGRGMAPEDVVPGGVGEFRARVKAPSTPGTYSLVWDMVEEHVAWFGAKGGNPVTVTVTVQ